MQHVTTKYAARLAPPHPVHPSPCRIFWPFCATRTMAMAILTMAILTMAILTSMAILTMAIYLLHTIAIPTLADPRFPLLLLPRLRGHLPRRRPVSLVRGRARHRGRASTRHHPHMRTHHARCTSASTSTSTSTSICICVRTRTCDAHRWVWCPKGWLAITNADAVLGGMLDFAGSGVVHLTG